MSSLNTPLTTHDEPLWTLPFTLLTLSHLLGALGYASMLLLPLYLAHLGGSRAEMGAIMSSAHLAGLLTRPVVGWSLDHLGRKRSLAFGGLLTALSLVAVLLISEVGPVAYGVRVLFGVAEGFLFTGYFAFASDLIPSARRTEGLALFGVAGLLPLLVNPIADVTGFEGAGLQPFIASVGALVALSALLLVWIKVPTPQSSPSQNSSSQNNKDEAPSAADPSAQAPQTLKDTLSHLITPQLKPVWWSTLAFAGGVALMMTFGSVVGESRGLTHPTSLWFTYVAGALSARLLGAKLPERLGPERLVRPSLLLYGAALLSVALSEGEVGMLVAGALAGVAHGYCFPVLTSLTVSAVEPRYRGRALAMFTGLWGGAAVLFAPLAGALADHIGDADMLLSFGLTLTLGALLASPQRFKSPSI